jgi:type II secretion system protein G
MIMRLQKRRAEKGFTLIELLIVIAIIGIIAALLIPNFLESLQKAKQKRTMGDMRNVGTAWFSWLTDQYGAAAAAGQDTISLPATYDVGTVETDLVPQYIQRIPTLDSWGGTLAYCRVPEAQLLAATQVMAIGSTGNDKTASVATCAGSLTPTTYDPTDYAEDIVWLDGFFVYYPNRTDLPTT